MDNTQTQYEIQVEFTRYHSDDDYYARQKYREMTLDMGLLNQFRDELNEDEALKETFSIWSIANIRDQASYRIDVSFKRPLKSDLTDAAEKFPKEDHVTALLLWFRDLLQGSYDEFEISGSFKIARLIFPVDALIPSPDKKRSVEMYVGEASSSGESGTWYTTYVDIPADTPEAKIREIAMERLYRELLDKNESFSFYGVYSIPPIEDNEQDGGAEA